MSYQVLARKWRPQKFEDVLGQELVTRTLQNAIRSGRVAHAFLFSGVRGVGKTTTARILAKALNCEKGPTPEPCGVCVSCNEIAAGNSIDVLEIDAASNRGIDNIRELRENVRYLTARDRFKIFIIDEAHMLSNDAFNALLKTLEEPPPHVKFILATTEHHKIPPTITSRCQQFDFKAIPFSLILSRLQSIAIEEGVEVSDYALRSMVSTAQGSMRDAQSLLDQTIAFCGKRISDADARALLGVADETLVVGLLDAVINKDRKKIVELMEQAQDGGIDAQNLCRRVIAHIRNLLVFRATAGEEKLFHLSDFEKEQTARQSSHFSEVDLIRFYDLLNRTENELRWNSHPFIHLEMALVKTVELARLPELEKIIDEFRKGGESDASRITPARAVTSSPPPSRKIPVNAPESKSAVVSDDVVRLPPFSERLLELAQKEALPLFSNLQHAQNISCWDGKVKIVFSSSDKIYHSLLSGADARQQLGNLCAKIVGTLPEIEIVVQDISVAPSKRNPVDDPKVKFFVEEFPGKIVVDPNIEDP
ncbi:MAG: DNA polymerase III subunit gamma/tau [Acidobacteria bacterium]|nr:DNA polymerase III subunit gamma/tau [Acidobacteriota bacterium]